MSFLHTIPKSFGYAWSGLKTAFKNEPNFRVHTLAALISLVLGIYVKLNPGEWILLLLTIALVVGLELINTSMEAVVNMVSPHQSEGAKIAKDTAAAAVMLGSLAAIGVGAFLFAPKFI